MKTQNIQISSCCFLLHSTKCFATPPSSCWRRWRRRNCRQHTTNRMGSGGCGRFLWQAVALGHTVIVANCIKFQNQIRLTGTVGLGSLVPRIAKPDGGDVPNINTDCSYTLSYDARRSKGAATVTATSVFGAMYAMATFSQPATLLALRCNVKIWNRKKKTAYFGI